MNPTPVVLYGEQVRLEPLDHAHADHLLEEAGDDEIWRYMPIPRPMTRSDVIGMIDKAWKAAAEGLEVPFAIISDKTDRAVGSTRFIDIHRPDRRLEIGWTWLGVGSQRTAINTETKLLLLRHAFEDLGALRVQLKTDGRNERSLRAIERIGAVKEGVLRKSRLTWDGVFRDTVYYSVLDTEWPAVKARLGGLLER
ncbi:MAG: GNAT family N-acetyltransferase [Gemmatimonadetes bacterium]|nr:GNAT family N-acetyltransferase [Gemmatimonadota bacterium]